MKLYLIHLRFFFRAIVHTELMWREMLRELAYGLIGWLKWRLS